MKIVKDWPPNIAEIDKKFHVKNRPGILYCYGDTIYNPSGGRIPQWLISHEEVHSQRQYEMGKESIRLRIEEGLKDPGFKDDDFYKEGAGLWWNRYLWYEDFRLEEELLAHQIEYQVYKLMHNRHESRGYLLEMAERLSGDMYGRCISKKEAKRLIKEVEDPKEQEELEGVTL